MRDYDGMSVHNLLGVAVCTPFLSDEEIVGLESALRSAVIREATLTIAVVKTQEYEDEITAPKGSPDRIVTMSQNVGLRGYVPDGEYYLIPREVKK